MQTLKCHYQIRKFLKDAFPSPSIILFAGVRHPQSEQMSLIMQTLERKYATLNVGLCQVGCLVSGRQHLKIDAIPTVWLLSNGQLQDVIMGTDVARFTNGVTRLCTEGFGACNPEYKLEDLFNAADEAVARRVEQIVQDQKLLLVGPAHIAAAAQASLQSRLGLKHLRVMTSDQLDSDHEFVEGLMAKHAYNGSDCLLFIDGRKYIASDIISGAGLGQFKDEMIQLDAMMRQKLHERLEGLIKKDTVVLFMKGTKESPFCKFSKEMVEILRAADIEFDFFNIFEDDAVREGLKEYSKWPTFPQLYVRGDLVGGVDVVKDLIEEAKGIENLKRALIC